MFLALDLIIWLLILEVAIFFGIAAANDKEWDGFSAFLALVGVAIAFWFTGTNPIDWVAINIGTILTGIVVWAGVGAATAWFKWLTVVNSPEVQKSIKDAYDSWFKKPYREEGDKFEEAHEFRKFTVPENAGNLIRWAVYWPMTLAWMISYRLIRWIGIKVFEVMKNLYQWTLDSAVNRALKDSSQ